MQLVPCRALNNLDANDVRHLFLYSHIGHFSMRRFRIPSVVIAIALFTVFAHTSTAQTIPFLVAGSGDLPSGSLPLAPGISADHNTQSGWGVKIGAHTGEGALQLIAPPDLSALTADFESVRPYRFTSSLSPNDVLACNYGLTTGPLPAAKPGRATFYSIDAGSDPASPLDDTFIITFLAEFRPALDECSGKFDKKRLKDGSFTMLAISDPVHIDLANGIVVSAASSGAPIPYTWYGVGTLSFKFPFGWF
jgi:hypothetical protein